MNQQVANSIEIRAAKSCNQQYAWNRLKINETPGRIARSMDESKFKPDTSTARMLFQKVTSITRCRSFVTFILKSEWIYRKNLLRTISNAFRWMIRIFQTQFRSSILLYCFLTLVFRDRDKFNKCITTQTFNEEFSTQQLFLRKLKHVFNSDRIADCSNILSRIRRTTNFLVRLFIPPKDESSFPSIDPYTSIKLELSFLNSFLPEERSEFHVGWKILFYNKIPRNWLRKSCLIMQII